MDQLLKQQLALWVKLDKEQSDFYHRAAQWAGLSDAAYWVLYCMCTAEDEITQSSLCKENFYPKQTINSAVARLCGNELVCLVSKKGSGNRKVLALTDGGKSFCEQYVTPILQAELDSFESLTETERELFLSLTEKQLRRMEKGMEHLWQ